jgi:hypothetical protein
MEDDRLEMTGLKNVLQYHLILILFLAGAYPRIAAVCMMAGGNKFPTHFEDKITGTPLSSFIACGL